MTQNKYISIGKILNFHGVQGEAKVGYSKNQADYIVTLKRVFVQINNEYSELKVKYVKLNNKTAIFKFDGINSINEILNYKNCVLYVPTEEYKDSLKENEFLVEDLIGMEVYSEDKKVGIIMGVTSNGANDLLSVKGNSQKMSLVPFVDALVPTVDIENKRVYINEIPGLIE